MPRISHLATSITIQLLTSAINFRKAGLILLTIFSLINCYFMLLDEQAYITFLAHYASPDGHISDINNVFFIRIQAPTILIAALLLLIDKSSIDLIKKQSLRNNSSLPWRQRSLPYIIACCAWLLISYSPFLFLDSKTIINLIKEDGFFQNCGAFFLFSASVLVFFLFYTFKEKKHLNKFNKGRNIWFLLLGLLFFFGAGEEISWGQRIFHFKTPEFINSNIQNEFSIHNLPWFDGRTEKPYFDKHGVENRTLKTGLLARNLTASSLMFYFCFLSFIALPYLYAINTKTRTSMNKLRLPIAPLFFSIFFIIEYNIYCATSKHYSELSSLAKQQLDFNAVIINHGLTWAVNELHETFISFLFLLTALWFIAHKRPSHCP